MNSMREGFYLKELISFHLICVPLSRSESFQRILLQQLQTCLEFVRVVFHRILFSDSSCEQQQRDAHLLDDGNSTVRNTLWILHIIVDDAVEHLLLILTREWRLAELQTRWVINLHLQVKTVNVIRENATNLSHKHLVDEDAHPPPVHRPGVVVIRQDLRSQKFRSSAECGGAISMPHPWVENIIASGLNAESSTVLTCRMLVVWWTKSADLLYRGQSLWSSQIHLHPSTGCPASDLWVKVNTSCTNGVTSGGYPSSDATYR